MLCRGAVLSILVGLTFQTVSYGINIYLGLGFSVFVTILITERFGSPIMKSASVIFGLLVGCIIAAATGYFDRSGIDSVSLTSLTTALVMTNNFRPPQHHLSGSILSHLASTHQ